MQAVPKNWSYAMPTGPSNDKPQQPKSSGFGGANHLLPNRNIWNPPHPSTHARGLSLSSKVENGGAPIHTSPESNVWGPSFPWNDEPARSTSTSPNRTRDGGLSRASTFGNGAEPHPTTAGITNGLNGDKNGFQDSQFPSQKRPSHDTSYLESMTSLSSSRDPTAAPSSRQPQGSSAYSDLYSGRSNGRANGRSQGHSHSNSFHSHRTVTNNSVSFPHQAANSRAFNMNGRLDDDLPMPFTRRVTVDHSATAATPLDQSSQTFQLNPGSQSLSESNGPRYPNGQDPQVDSLTNQFSSLKRPSVGRVSPSTAYRLESNSSGTYAPPDPWNRPATRDPRSADSRRGSAQAFAPSFTPPYYPQHYPYANLPPQFSAAYLDPYNQGFRTPVLPNYALSPLAGGYPLNSNLPPIRPAADHDPTQSMRSPVLDEYKNNKNKRWELKDFYNYMVEFSGDQHGSRFIQMKLETANSDEKDQVFREIEPNAIQLMKDVFGNYVVQKFFEHGNQVQKKILAEKIKSQMVDLSVQVYACRVVQKALEHVLVEQQLEMVKELAPEALRVMKDQNGNHVVQKIIGLLDRKHLDFVMDALRGQVMMLSNHNYGCRVVQRMMDYGTDEDNDIIVGELRPSAHLLLNDQYGNYVAQHIIKFGRKPEDRLRMVSLVLDELVDLCKHKFASNVVETCIIHGTPELRSTIRERFEEVGADGTNLLQQLVRDSYGNYVIQKMAMHLMGDEQMGFVEQIKPLFYTLKRTGNSRQVSAMEKMLDAHSRGELKPELKQPGEPAVEPVPCPTNATDNLENGNSPSTSMGAVGAPVSNGRLNGGSPKTQNGTAT